MFISGRTQIFFSHSRIALFCAVKSEFVNSFSQLKLTFKNLAGFQQSVTLTGKQARIEDCSIRSIFKSGRNKRILLSTPRYAFTPSNN